MMNENNKTEFFKTNVINASLISDTNGILPIKGNHIGQITLARKSKAVLIEIKQCADPQLIAYFEGHLICKDADWKLVQTEINGAVFTFDLDKTNYSRYELQLNNNRQGIIIKCSEVELLDYRQTRKPIEEYKNIYIGSLYGKFFSIRYE